MCAEAMTTDKNEVGFMITNLILSQQDRFTRAQILSQFKQITAGADYKDAEIMSVINEKMTLLKNYGRVREGILSYSVCA